MDWDHDHDRVANSLRHLIASSYKVVVAKEIYFLIFLCTKKWIKYGTQTRKISGPIAHWQHAKRWIWHVQKVEILDTKKCSFWTPKSRDFGHVQMCWKVRKSAEITKSAKISKNRENLEKSQKSRKSRKIAKISLSGRSEGSCTGSCLRPDSGRFWQVWDQILAPVRTPKKCEKFRLSGHQKSAKIWAVDRGDRRAQQAVESHFRT